METVENKEFVYEFGNFVLDPREKTLFADGVAMHLPAKEFETLLLLVEHNGHALSKEEMLSAIWRDSFVEESNLVKQISRLRKIFNTNGNKLIETVPKHGYRFSADLRLVETEARQPVIVEKRTVQRVTIAVDRQVEPESRHIGTLPPARRAFYSSPWFAFLIIAFIGIGFVTWQKPKIFFAPGPAPIDPFAPVRLTDNPNDDTGPQWSKDGRIRFTRLLSANRAETWIMNADGTAQSAVPMPDGKRIFSWSPDEKKVLFQKDGDSTKSYLSNADGSSEVLLPFRGGNWSADSTMLTYFQKVSGDNFDIFIYDVETGKSRNITNHEAFDADPSFSPDGKQVVFVSTRDGNGDIYLIDIDGGNLRRLTFDPMTDAHPAFSPDGTQISFNSDRENENVDVYIMNADGNSNAIKLTHLDKSNETLGPLGWSRDGTKIVFTSDRDGKDDIYVVSAEMVRAKLVLSEPNHDIAGFSFSPDGERMAYSIALDDKSGELRIYDVAEQITTLVRKTELSAISPTWSSDGGSIAYSDRIGGNSEVCVVKPDGSGFQNLTNNSSQDTGPSWSPDGKYLSFVTTRGASQIYRMNADGSDPQPISPRQGWEGDPVWSPDGQKIIFVCDRVDSPGNVTDICQINIDGTGERRILFHRDHDSQPAVSPDGRRIAFTASSDGNPEIYVVNADGTGLLRLTRNSANDQAPKWSADGKTLAFLSDRDGMFAVYKIELPRPA